VSERIIAKSLVDVKIPGSGRITADADLAAASPRLSSLLGLADLNLNRQWDQAGTGDLRVAGQKPHAFDNGGGPAKSSAM
jgi:hypothetical protein